MSTPIRVYDFINRITKTRTTELINLTQISRILVKNKYVEFTFSNEKESIAGNFILFFGGKNETKRIYFDTHEEAKKEFDSVQIQLETYYKKY